MTQKIIREENLLPEKIVKLAYQTTSGELAWKPKDIPVLFTNLEKLNLAILSGEFWAIDQDEIFGILPLKDGSTSVFHWSIDKQQEETWESFVARSILKAANAINTLNPKNEVSEELSDKLYINLTLCNKANFRDLKYL